MRAVVTRSLSKAYNHNIIIEAVAELKKRGVMLRVDIIGDGPLREKLELLSEKLKVTELIDFMGLIPNDELPEILGRYPIYLSTPITEGASSSLMEAMAVGCFPIVTDLPGNRSFIQDRANGMLVSPSSVVSLVECILDIKSVDLKKAVAENRILAERIMNRRNNMKIFFEKYQNLLSQKG
jgi:glycosyltransferase involved in cell wall biosynthesis